MELSPPGDFFVAVDVSWRGVGANGAEVRVGHTAELGAEALRAVRGLLEDVFGNELDESDWDHALGGMHALIYEGPRLVAHGSVIQRRLLHCGRAHRTGYVESVVVARDRRRLGYGGVVMERLEEIIEAAYELGALGASEAGALLYEARGWRKWRGKTWALTPEGIVRTAQEDHDVYVRDVSVALDLAGDLICDWREGELW